MFYGWYIVLSSIVLLAFHSGIMIYGFTAFIDPIAVSFGWSYTQISLASSLKGLESGALNPLFGFLIDRYPARRLLFISVIIYGTGLFYLSHINTLFTFYLANFIIGFGSSLGLHMVIQTTVVRWFKRNIGKASGILFTGMGLGGVLIPSLVMLIDTFGWRSSSMLLALGSLIIGVPVSLVFRTKPEEYGLVPDGISEEGTDEQEIGSDASPPPDKSLREALRMPAFWAIGIATMVQLGCINAVVIHMMPYFSQIGFDRTASGWAAMSVPVISIMSRFPFGLLSDMIDKRYIFALSLALIGMGLFTFSIMTEPSWFLVIFSLATIGFGSGGMMPIRLPIFRAYFGTKNFGKIYGIGNIFLTTGIITGAPLAGWIFDVYGRYNSAWFIMTGCVVVAFIVIVTMPGPHGAR